VSDESIDSDSGRNLSAVENVYPLLKSQSTPRVKRDGPVAYPLKGSKRLVDISCFRSLESLFDISFHTIATEFPTRTAGNILLIGTP